MNIYKTVEFPIFCRLCRCYSNMDNLRLKVLPNKSELLKGKCISCSTLHSYRLSDVEMRDLKMSILLHE